MSFSFFIEVNWCQHWFEYAPVPPVNILAIIENVLRDHDPQLLAFLTEKNITSHDYAWSLLETGFSEVLTIKEWCILWDHILSNEPSFLLMIPVAYNIINRSVLAQISSVHKFEAFYHNQNAIAFKRFISKIYFLKRYTRSEIHPRQYLNNFKPLVKDCYPLFEDGPKAIVTTTETTTKTKSSKSSKSAKTHHRDHTGDVKSPHGFKTSSSDDKNLNFYGARDVTACGDKIPTKKSILSNKSCTSKKNTTLNMATTASPRLRGGVVKTKSCVCNECGDSVTGFYQCSLSPDDENRIEAIEQEICKVQRDIYDLNYNQAKQKDITVLKNEEAKRIKSIF